MISVDQDDRPTIKSIFQEFKLVHNQLSSVARVMMVGYIDINELVDLNNDKLQHVIKRLKRMNFVCLVDQNKKYHERYVEIKRILEVNKLYVCNEVVQYIDKTQDMADAIAAHIKALPHAHTRVYSGCFLLNKSEHKAYPLQNNLNINGIMFIFLDKLTFGTFFFNHFGIPVTVSILDSHTKQLNDERNRLQGKNANELKNSRNDRIHLLGNAVKDIKSMVSSNVIKFGVFENHLCRLKKMLHAQDKAKDSKTDTVVDNLIIDVKKQSKAEWAQETKFGA